MSFIQFNTCQINGEGIPTKGYILNIASIKGVEAGCTDEDNLSKEGKRMIFQKVLFRTGDGVICVSLNLQRAKNKSLDEQAKSVMKQTMWYLSRGYKKYPCYDEAMYKFDIDPNLYISEQTD